MENSNQKPFYQIFNGVRIPSMFKPQEIMDYKPNPDDVFIVTYPKSGTTWMQVVALYIFRKGKELNDYTDFKTACPFIERTGLEGIINMPRPGAFKTHLPYNLLTKSPEAKYVFVARNPKDTCVSLFYHSKKGRNAASTFDEFFERYMVGDVESSDYFDHLQSWYPHRNDKGIFYTTYEDMKEDLRSVVLRLAAFLGQDYIEAIEKDSNVLNNILKFSGFEYMKEKLFLNFSRQKDKDIKEIDEEKKEAIETDDTPRWKRPGMSDTHFRKGVIGDWRNHFSDEQSERLNRKFFDRFGGTEIYEKYKPYL